MGSSPNTLQETLDQHDSDHVVRARPSFSTYHSSISVVTGMSLQAMADHVINPNREVQRTNALLHVARAHPWRAHIDHQRDFCSLTVSEQDDRLYSFAKKICKREQFVFCRFRQLSIFNILKAQHELILLEEKLHYDYKGDYEDDHEVPHGNDLGQAFNAYIDTIKAFQVLEQIKPHDREDIKPMSANLAHKLHEPHYWDVPDALYLLDLKVFPKVPHTEPEAPKSEPKVSVEAETTDSLRLFLQVWIPAAFLDQEGRNQRKLVGEDAEAGGRGAQAMRRDALARMGPMHISPVLDFLARMLMCLFAPIIVLVFVKDSLTLTLVLTVVFVLIVVLVLPLVCRSSTLNEALLGATAAYAAVLVVFVANASVSVKRP